MDSKTIKLFATKHFEIELVQLVETGTFVVRGERYGHEEFYSDDIKDLTMAAFIFEARLVELEGH